MIKFTISNLKFSTSAGDLDKIYGRLCTVGVDTVFGVLENKFDYFCSKEALDEFQKEFHASPSPEFMGGLEKLEYPDDVVNAELKINGEEFFLHNFFYLLNKQQEYDVVTEKHEKRLEEVERVDFDENGDMVNIKEKHWVWVPVNEVTRKDVLKITMSSIENLTTKELFNFSFEKFSAWFKNIYPEAEIKLV
jgi:hypothetical protein